MIARRRWYFHGRVLNPGSVKSGRNLPKLDDANTVAYGLRSSFDRKLRTLRGIANSGLTDLDNLFRDEFSERVVVATD